MFRDPLMKPAMRDCCFDDKVLCLLFFVKKTEFDDDESLYLWYNNNICNVRHSILSGVWICIENAEKTGYAHNTVKCDDKRLLQA